MWPELFECKCQFLSLPRGNQRPAWTARLRGRPCAPGQPPIAQPNFSTLCDRLLTISYIAGRQSCGRLAS
jgi:hypothetical protein